MTTLDDLDPKEFENTARSVIATCTDAEGTQARARLLAEAGLLGVLAPESVGGLGLPMRFAVPIASAASAGLLGFPLIESLLLGKALSGIDPTTATVICAGETVATIAWTGVAEAGIVSGAPLAHEAAHVLVFRADGSAVLTAMGEGATVEAVSDFDLESPEATIRLTGTPRGVEINAATVADLRSQAQVLRAALVLGSASQCLAMAMDYAQDRVQFGKPLSASQVLRHRMSRDALAVETLRSGIARVLKEPAEGAAMAREAAWLWAAEAGPSVAESAIQLFGGMGFTWEVPLHRHLRKMQSQAIQGAAGDGIEALGAALIAGNDNCWYKEIPDVV
jgi:alkylation response protein AidB-like acyl-CoA dehydrogenase